MPSELAGDFALGTLVLWRCVAVGRRQVSSGRLIFEVLLIGIAAGLGLWCGLAVAMMLIMSVPAAAQENDNPLDFDDEEAFDLTRLLNNEKDRSLTRLSPTTKIIIIRGLPFLA